MKIQNQKERKMGLEDKRQRESKRATIVNYNYDGWVWDIDMDKVINAYHTFLRKARFGVMFFIMTKDKLRQKFKVH